LEVVFGLYLHPAEPRPGCKGTGVSLGFLEEGEIFIPLVAVLALKAHT